MIAFYHDKDFDALKLGCTLPNLGNICLYESTDTKFHVSWKQIKTCWGKTENMMLVVLLSFFHGKQLLLTLFFPKVHKNMQLSIVGLILANYTPNRWVNSYPPVFIRVGISIHRQVDSHLDKTRPVAFKKWSSVFLTSKTRLQKRELLYRKQTKEKWQLQCWWFFFHCNNVFEARGCFHHFCPCQDVRPSLTAEGVQVGSKKVELDELRRSYIREKGFIVIEMWECEWWSLCNRSINVKKHIRENFPCRRSLAVE